MNIRNRFVRTSSVLAGASALAMVAAGPASAHHCLMDFKDAARAQVASGTSWMMLSDYLAFAAVNFVEVSEECAANAESWTTQLMAHKGLETEPFVHMKATVGGGAAHRGKDVPVFTYLSEDDLNWIIGVMFASPNCP